MYIKGNETTRVEEEDLLIVQEMTKVVAQFLAAQLLAAQLANLQRAVAIPFVRLLQRRRDLIVRLYRGISPPGERNIHQRPNNEQRRSQTNTPCSEHCPSRARSLSLSSVAVTAMLMLATRCSSRRIYPFIYRRLDREKQR